MFGRKPPSGSGDTPQPQDRIAPAQFQPAAQRAATPAPISAPARPAAESEAALPARPMPVQPPSPRPTAAGGEAPQPSPPQAPPRRPAEPAREVRKLLVGREITLAGEIAACDHLIVEGTVEASVRECHRLEVAESGLFRGAVEISEAEIAGRFEGEIIVQGRLVVRSTGRIDGKIQYGELAVDAGGKLDGEIRGTGKVAPKAISKPTAPPLAELSPQAGGPADELKV